MAAGDTWVNCSTKNLSAEQLFRAVIVDDGNGNPAVRVYNPDGGGSGGSGYVPPVNNLRLQHYITGADNANVIAQLASWKSSNPAHTIVDITQLTGNDGVTGILIEYKI